jgi:hypothetical protein
MTTIAIDDTMVGVTVAQNGILSAIRYLVAGGEMYAKFTIVDDASPYDTVPKQLFNSDLLDASTNLNGTLKSPFGVLLQNGNQAFGNLTIAACPKNATFELDATGALPLAQIEAQRANRDRAAELRSPQPPAPMPPHGYYQSWQPPLTPPPPPLDPAMVALNAEAEAAGER